MTQARPTQAAITRAVKAVVAAGIDVGPVEIGADGSIKIYPAEVKAKPKPKGPVAWD
ncbi:hypothetical protein [Loktanella sp. R86503]|uniref:hypothetical protein n=1 Tax=Loktanella sp. R86503 TaxID=3093847 RepID=UPI0036DA0AC0